MIAGGAGDGTGANGGRHSGSKHRRSDGDSFDPLAQAMANGSACRQNDSCTVVRKSPDGLPLNVGSLPAARAALLLPWTF
jgi:hypothetical protein